MADQLPADATESWPALDPVWCEKGFQDCWEQPLSRPKDAPLQPCRWCADSDG